MAIIHNYVTHLGVLRMQDNLLSLSEESFQGCTGIQVVCYFMYKEGTGSLRCLYQTTPRNIFTAAETLDYPDFSHRLPDDAEDTIVARQELKFLALMISIILFCIMQVDNFLVKLLCILHSGICPALFPFYVTDKQITLLYHPTVALCDGSPLGCVLPMHSGIITLS